jgi:hypothetical protein
VQWVTTEAGKNMPIDAAPVDDGNITVMTIGEGRRVAHVHGKPADIEPGAARYKSHFVTCPQAAQHRKPKVTNG